MRIRIPTPSLDFLLGFGRIQPSRMPATNENWSRGWMVGCKVLLIIPVALTAFMQKRNYELVKKHPQMLESPPYHPLTELSFFFAYIGVSFHVTAMRRTPTYINTVDNSLPLGLCQRRA